MKLDDLNLTDHNLQEHSTNLNALELIKKEDQFKLELIAAVSHEIRTPLAITKQLVSLIYDETAGAINNKQREILVKTQANLDRLKNILDEMLDLSKIEKDKFNLKYSIVNLNDLFKDIEYSYQNLIKEKNIKLKLSLPQKVIEIFIDAERTRQAVANLLNNAIKFSKIGGHIRLDVEIQKKFIHVGVIDQGIGISKDNCEKIFDRFVKLPQQDVFMNQGIGLGLSIVQEIIQKQGGDVWVKSRLGQGSSFTISLPRFHTHNTLSPKSKNLIKQKLQIYPHVSVINLSVINFNEIHKKINISSVKFINEIKGILQTVICDIVYSNSSNKLKIITNPDKGTINIILSETRQNQLMPLSKLLIEKLKSYCLRNNFINVFMALGLSYLSSKDKKLLCISHFSDLDIKELYISSDMRRAPRIKYQSRLEIMGPQSAVQQGKILDISYYGVCFAGTRPLPLEQRVRISIYLYKICQLVEILARIAWVFEIDPFLPHQSKSYKIGMEFIKFKKGDYEKLVKELKYHL